MRWWIPDDARHGEALPADWLAGLARRLADGPDRARESGLAVLKRGRRKDLYRVRAPDGAPLLLKLSRYAEGATRWRRLRASKARRELRVARRLRAAGVHTPLPRAAGELRQLGLLHCCVLLVEELPGARDLSQLARAGLLPEQRRALAVELGALARRLHEVGLDQSDFAPNNLLQLEGGHLVPIDFERARCRWHLPWRRRLEMLAQLESRLAGAGMALRWRALLAYAGGDAGSARALLPGLARARRRLARRELAHLCRISGRESRHFAALERDGWSGVARRGHPELATLDPGAAASAPGSRLRCSARAGRRTARLWGAACWLHARGFLGEPVACLGRGGELRLLVVRAPEEAAWDEVSDRPEACRAREQAARRLAGLFGDRLEIRDELWIFNPLPSKRFEAQLAAPPTGLC